MKMFVAPVMSLALVVLAVDAANEMRRQLDENTDNQEVFNKIMAELLGRATPP